MSPLTTPCELVQHLGRPPCIEGRSFACTATSVWAGNGCRGFFRCGSAQTIVRCGPSENCSCPSIPGSVRDRPERGRHQRPCSAPRVWAATSTHSSSMAAWQLLRGTAGALLSTRLVRRFTINFWDGRLPPDLSSKGDDRAVPPQLQLSTVPGAKGLFFKQVLTPVATFGFQYIYLFDADMHTSLTVFPLGHFFETMALSGALAMQPTITRRLPPGPVHRHTAADPCTPANADACFGARGGRSTDWPHLRSGTWDGECMLEVVVGVELQAAAKAAEPPPVMIT